MKNTLKKYIIYSYKDNGDLYRVNNEYYDSLYDATQDFFDPFTHSEFYTKNNFYICMIELYKYSNNTIEFINEKIIRLSLSTLFKSLFIMNEQDELFLTKIIYDILNYSNKTILSFSYKYYQEYETKIHIGKYIYKDNEWLFKFEEEKEIRI